MINRRNRIWSKICVFAIIFILSGLCTYIWLKPHISADSIADTTCDSIETVQDKKNECSDTVSIKKQPAKVVNEAPVADNAAAEAPALEEYTAATPMRTYRLTGYLIDEKTGKKWPVSITTSTDDEGYWGKTTYKNNNSGTVIPMQASGGYGSWEFVSKGRHEYLSIHIERSGSTYSGQAYGSAGTLSVRLHE